MPPKFNPGVKIQKLDSVPQRPTGQLDAVPQPYVGEPVATAAPEQQRTGLLALAARGKSAIKPIGVPVVAPNPAAAASKPVTKPTVTFNPVVTSLKSAPKPALVSKPPPAPKPTKEKVKTVPLEGYEFEDPGSIDFWIETEYIDDIGEDETIHPKKSLNAKLFGDPFSKYKTIHTIGDGSCLLHSILTCVSDAYRKVTTDAVSYTHLTLPTICSV